MSRNRSRGIPKFSSLSLNKNSSSKSEKISKYFKSVPKSTVELDVTDDHELGGTSSSNSLTESPYKNCLIDIKPFDFNDANDFKTPTATKKISKIAQLKPPKNGKIVKKSKKQVSKSTKPPLRHTIDAIFGNCNDVNPEHLQMALALSESSYEAENPNHVTETDSPHQSTQEKSMALKLALEQYGFKCGKSQLAPLNRISILQTKKVPKKSRYRFITPILYIRTEEEREALISSKISLILNENSKFCNNFFIETPKMFSENLEKVWRQSRIFKINSLSVEELPENVFCVKQLGLSPPKSSTGVLLKKWGGIAGRDVTPPREIINFVKTTPEIGNKGGSVRGVGGLNRSVSPDLFASEDEDEENFSKQTFDNDHNAAVSSDSSGDVGKFSFSFGGTLESVCNKENKIDVEEFYDLTQSSEELEGAKNIKNEAQVKDKNVNEDLCDHKELIRVQSDPEGLIEENYGEIYCLSDSSEESTNFNCNDEKIEKSSFQKNSFFREETTNENSYDEKQLKEGESVICMEDRNFGGEPYKFDLTQSSDGGCESQKEEQKLSQRKNSVEESFAESVVRNKIEERHRNDEKSTSAQKAENQNFEKSSRQRNIREDTFNQEFISFFENKDEEHLSFTQKNNYENVKTKFCQELYDLTQSSNESVEEPNPNLAVELSDNSRDSCGQEFDLKMSFTRECYDWVQPLEGSFQVSSNIPLNKDTKSSNFSIEGIDDIVNVDRKEEISLSQESILISDDELNYSNTFSTPKNKPVRCSRPKSSLYELSEEEEFCQNDTKPKTQSTQVSYDFSEENLCQNATKCKTELGKIEDLRNNLNPLEDSFNDILNQSNIFNTVTKTNEIATRSSKISSPLINRNNDATPERTSTTTAKNTPDNGFILKTSNVTPMANFSEMDTPKLAKELQKFGVKPLKRQRSIKMLKYIYESTHPLVGPCEETSDDETDKQVLKKRKKSHQLDGDVIKDNEIEELVFERTQSKKIFSCRIPLQIVWHNFVVNNPEIRENILMYEPLQLEVIHSMLKEQGFKFNIQDLLTFLDKKCVTIRTNQGQSGSRRRY